MAGVDADIVKAHLVACRHRARPHFLGLSNRLSALCSLTRNRAWIIPGIQNRQVSARFSTACTGLPISSTANGGTRRGTLKKCVNSQAVYPLSEQHGLEAQERRYTAHEEGKH